MSHPYYDNFGLPRSSGTLIAKELPKDGNRSWKVTTQPIIEPVTVTNVKLFGRIDTDEEDDLIRGFIESARMATEKYIGRALISQTITTVLDYWPGQILELPRPPLISVTSIVDIDEDATETTYSSDNYYLNTTAEPGQIIIKRDSTWPTNTARDYGRFIIRSLHGYGADSIHVPRPLREGIMLWASIIYATRVLDTKNLPPEVKNKFDLYKMRNTVIR
jgi:uncharacterized phiE125 gp8 family phage protein